MGWGSGSEVMSGIISATQKLRLSFPKRINFYIDIIEVLENRDWDTQCECSTEDDAYYEALKQLHPDWYQEY